MGARALRVLLGTWILVALTPALIWVVAVLFDGVDDQLRDALAWSWYAVPFALGAGAVTLAVHGLMLNAAVRDVVAEQFDEIREGMGAPQPVSASGAPIDAAEADEGAEGSWTRTMKTARVAPPPQTKGQRIRKRAKSMARTELRRRTGF